MSDVDVKARCARYGHVLIDHELLGLVCGRCGGFDPTWQLSDDGAYYPTVSGAAGNPGNEGRRMSGDDSA